MRLSIRPPLVAALGLLLAISAAGAQPPSGCTAAEHRQFDFWLGEWDVRHASGKEAGRNRITSIHDGCALFEEWRGAGGYTGSSLTLYDRERKRWHQSWVDNTGGLLLLNGGFSDGTMTLSGVSVDAGSPQKRTLQRVRWSLQPDGRVRQLWEASENDGGDWKTVFDGWYTRRP